MDSKAAKDKKYQQELERIRQRTLEAMNQEREEYARMEDRFDPGEGVEDVLED